MVYKLKFSDSQTAGEAKKIIQNTHGFKVKKVGANLHFVTEYGKNNAKITLTKKGMKGLNKQ